MVTKRTVHPRVLVLVPGTSTNNISTVSGGTKIATETGPGQQKLVVSDFCFLMTTSYTYEYVRRDMS